MAAELIGYARCPVPSCGSDRARLSLAKTKLPVLTCNACNCQLFARSDRSDRGLRSLLVAQPEPTNDTKPANAPTPPAPTPPAPAPKRMGWGVLGGGE